MNVLALVLMTLAAPATHADSTVTCKHVRSGQVLTWNEKYGELTVKDKDGNDLDSQDALKLGKRSYERGITKIDIIYGDETDYHAIAVIESTRAHAVSTITYDGKTYDCK